jgi:hypothetical protein
MERNELFEVARRIGRRIADRAQWSGEACTWTVDAFDPAIGRQRADAADGAIYQGTAGIALFLGELGRAGGGDEVERAALGGIRHALDFAGGLPAASLGFYSGRVGIAWVAARLAVALGRPELRERAAAALAPIAGHEREDGAFDVIAGAAGAIPALLTLRRELGRDDLLESACRLGDRLIEAAWREPGGWSWPTGGRSASRNLAGFGHGASGIALALLELHRTTGRGRYRFAAEMAFLYERRAFDPETSNWPDFRHPRLSELLYSDDPEALRREVEAGNVPPYSRTFMNAWCHGAAGIGLARVRAHELTGREVFRREAEAAVRSTLPRLRPPVRWNYSLCHGAGGNCELLLAAAGRFGDPDLRAVCDDCAEFGAETYERTGRPWPIGTAEHYDDPSLLLGEAGVGHFYLRLADEETAPLLLQEPPQPAERPAEDGGFGELAAEWVDQTFGGTRRAFAALGVPLAAPATDPELGDGEPLETTPVEAAYAALSAAVETAEGTRRERLADAFALERERYQLAALPIDRSVAYVQGVIRPAPEEVDWSGDRFTLGGGARRVATAGDAYWLLARPGGDQPLTRRIGPLTALTVEALESPALLDELVERIAGALDGGDGLDRPALAARVVDQLRELYRVGLIDLADEERPRLEAASG